MRARSRLRRTSSRRDWCDVTGILVGFDHKWSGAAGSVKSCVDVYKANWVCFRNCEFTNGQYHGLKVSACNDVLVSGNTFSMCYYDGVGLGGGLKGSGTGDLPYGANRCRIKDNSFTDCYAGAIAQVYVYDLVISGNTLTRSSIQIGQPCFRFTVSHNTIKDSCTATGPVAKVSGPVADGIFVESCQDGIVSRNIITGVSGNGIYASGSEISTVPVGPNEGLLPLKRCAIKHNIVTASAATGILVAARSTNFAFPGLTNIDGDTVMVCGNTVTSCATGMAINTVRGGKIAGNYIALSNTHGLTISASRDLQIEHNTVKNNSQVSPGTYHGIKFDQATLRPTFLSNTVIDDQTVPTQAFGIYDAVLDGGVASMARYRTNIFYGNTAAAVFPLPAIPTLGTWLKGDIIEFYGIQAAGGYMGVVCTTPGTPGTWKGYGAIAA
jgi:hypothetical protein